MIDREGTIMGAVLEESEKDVSLQLRVAEAYHKDAGKGVARIGADALATLSLENGGVVEINGKDKVYAIAWPGNPEDPQDLIRIDGNTRANLGAGIDSKVSVARAEARPARKIVVAPTRQIRLMGGPQYLLRMLQGRAVVKGEMLRVEMINSSLNLAVVSTMPAGAVLVTSRDNHQHHQRDFRRAGAASARYLLRGYRRPFQRDQGDQGDD